jgi:4-amino-4-deoxy-L-arabinose transferase-like glycosyltransferase
MIWMDRKLIIVLLLVCYGLMVALRLTAPFDIDAHDQGKQGLYILDVVKRGSFFLPTERGTIPATKPPFYNWIAAGISVIWGDVTDLTIRVPAALSGVGVVLLTFLMAEMLFSKEVGLFAGLVLISSFHFAKLSTTARTDMMLCFLFSLSLYFFLFSYQRRKEGSVYNTLMFVSMGLGSITKGPVAFFLPLFVILVFLFFVKDLKWLRSMQLGKGIGIWVFMMLCWFLPALVKGGRQFFDIVVYDETINRFLGIGTRAEKGRPFYYLVGHFFGKFLPWSLFVPSAIMSHWRARKYNGKQRLLFLVAWFFTVLIFFSISSGKRSDYILPLYPATSIIVAHFWLSSIARDDPHPGKNHLRIISLLYLGGCFLMSAGLVILVGGGDPVYLAGRISKKGLETMRALHDTISARPVPFLLIGLSLAFTSLLGMLWALRRDMRVLFVAVSVASGLYLLMYFHFLSPDATTMSGEQKKAFCSNAAGKMDSIENLVFYRVPNSILFYMGKNTRPLSKREVLEFFREKKDPYLITREADYLKLREHADFDFVVLEESEFVRSDGKKYVLLGKKGSDHSFCTHSRK